MNDMQMFLNMLSSGKNECTVEQFNNGNENYVRLISTAKDNKYLDNTEQLVTLFEFDKEGKFKHLLLRKYV